jgi:LPS-assembly lipoprotein
MWCSDRRRFLAGLGALALTSACGFSPVYREGGTGQALRGAIRADDPVSRSDFQFLTAFEELLGQPVSPRYALAYSISTRRQGAGVLDGFGATRVQTFGTLDFTVTDIATGTERAAGQITANAAHSTTGTQLASLTAAEDAELRLMRMLAERLVTRLYTEPGLSAA